MREYSDRWQGICPVHHGDNTTAFVLYKSNLAWTCFTHSCHGRGRVGSIFNLICKLRNCTYKESVDILSALYGINGVNQDVLEKINFAVSVENMKLRKKDQEIKILPDELIALYKQYKPIYYLKERNYSEELLDYFDVGYCPENIEVPEHLYRYVYGNGDGEIQHFPFFAKRCVIPIHTCNGELMGFTGRTTNGSGRKFLHTPHMLTTRTLYNWHRAKKFIQSCGEVIVCESPGSVWGWHQAGFLNAVATLGASLDRHQIKIMMNEPLLKRVIIAYDADDAGRKGTQRAIKNGNGKINLCYIDLADGCDYDTMSKQDIHYWYNRRKIV